LNGAYHSYQELEFELKVLVRAYPSIARLYIVGKSLENRNIYALKISDNVSIKENEPGIAFLGCHHAREWISLEVPLLTGKHLLENYNSDGRVKFLVDSAEIWIVPLVNPDGLQYSILNYRLWRKNRRLNDDGSYGVDLNRNYSFGWAYDNEGSSPVPSSADYRGLRSFSEPEAEAINNLFLNHNFAAAISYHSFSQSILYPWGYLDQATEDEPLFQQLSSAMAELIYQVNGRIYEAGRAASSLYLTNGDFADWAYGFFKIPVFTIELPPLDLVQGGFVNSEEDINKIFLENLPASLFLIDWAIANYQLTGPGGPSYIKRELEKRPEIIVKGSKDATFKGKDIR
jgi:murein tripeptide amidase MpaA